MATPKAEKGSDVREEIREVTIRFAGDSGDGMQLTGDQMTYTTALGGQDLATLPDYPAEIRAPAGSLPGVSAFQLQFSSHQIRTPGDAPSVLVAMNPAALKTNVGDLEEGGFLIVDENAFTKPNLQKAGYATNPLEDDSLAAYRVVPLPITDLTLNAVKETGLSNKEAVRCKNFLTLGLLYFVFDKDTGPTLQWIEEKFKKRPEIVDANSRALKAGYNYARTIQLFTTHYTMRKAELPPGTYRRLSGNEAAALGLVCAGLLSGKSLFYGSYPITPASEILHALARYKNCGVRTFQAEDEIAAVSAAIGASFAGALGVTGSSGPGVALKQEAIGLAVMTELPLVIVNVQRAGPSTGMPTKTEQSDLYQAIVGRNGECPAAVLAAATPGDCFHMALEAARIAMQFMTPVFLLTDGYLANGSEPFRIPDLAELPKLDFPFRDVAGGDGFLPYARDERTLSRPWAIPGTAGLEHRIGGLEKDHLTGNVSYDPQNHDRMVRLRQEKIDRIADFIPEAEVFGEPEGDLLVIGWGGTHGAITSAVEDLRKEGRSVSAVHLRYLNPFPRNLESIIRSFRKVAVPELNLGQLVTFIRARYLCDAVAVTKVEGKPFKVGELKRRFIEILEG
jgi:2-oxoglutarate ferredoxin oxidoreductase subunit alpha